MFFVVCISVCMYTFFYHRPSARGLDSEVEGLKTMCVRNWRRKSQDRHQWCAIVEEAKVHDGL